MAKRPPEYGYSRPDRGRKFKSRDMRQESREVYRATREAEDHGVRIKGVNSRGRGRDRQNNAKEFRRTDIGYMGRPGRKR